MAEKNKLPIDKKTSVQQQSNHDTDLTSQLIEQSTSNRNKQETAKVEHNTIDADGFEVITNLEYNVDSEPVQISAQIDTALFLTHLKVVIPRIKPEDDNDTLAKVGQLSRLLSVSYLLNHSKSKKPKILDKLKTDQGYKKYESLCSTDWQDTNQYGYKAIACIDNDSKVIDIHTAGTDLFNVDDLIDDVKIACNFSPNKIQPMRIFIDKIIMHIGGPEKAKEYKFNLSGHSLGAVVAEITAAEIDSRGYNIEQCTTFDNPGSKQLVTYMINNNMFSGPNNVQVSNLATRCETYNSPPNLINMTNPQLAKNIYLVIQQSELDSIKSRRNITQKDLGNFSNKDTSLLFYLIYIASSAHFMLKQFFNYLGITKALEGLKYHKIKNFTKDGIVIIRVDKWITRADGQRVLTINSNSIADNSRDTSNSTANNITSTVAQGDITLSTESASNMIPPGSKSILPSSNVTSAVKFSTKHLLDSRDHALLAEPSKDSRSTSHQKSNNDKERSQETSQVSESPRINNSIQKRSYTKLIARKTTHKNPNKNVVTENKAIRKSNRLHNIQSESKNGYIKALKKQTNTTTERTL